MTSSISGSMSFAGQMRMPRPDPAQMASKLFSQLDTKNQGYIEKSDLQSAFDKISGSGSSTSSSDIDAVFQQLDGDSDGKITKDEMSSGLSKLAQELDSQFNGMRMQGFGGQGGAQGMGGMPPPPPPENDAGFSKDQLSAQLDEIGSSDSQRSSLIGNIVNHFEAADSDGDGKVSFQEAMAFDQSNSDSSSTGSSSGNSASDSTAASSEARVMHQIMQLMHAYGGSGQDSAQSALSSLLSVSA